MAREQWHTRAVTKRNTLQYQTELQVNEQKRQPSAAQLRIPLIALSKNPATLEL
jgi:hypothetical protein